MATVKDCKTIQPLLAEYVDGALAENADWDVRMHLGGCAVCSQIAADFSATARLVSGLEMLEPSANFEAMLARRIADVSLKAHKPSLLDRLPLFDRLRDWWESPRLRPALVASAALTALLPAAVVVGVNMQKPTAKPAPVVAAQAAPSVEQFFGDHASYAASGPLSDQSGLLPGGDSGVGEKTNSFEDDL